MKRSKTELLLLQKSIRGVKLHPHMVSGGFAFDDKLDSNRFIESVQAMNLSYVGVY